MSVKSQYHRVPCSFHSSQCRSLRHMAAKHVLALQMKMVFATSRAAQSIANGFPGANGLHVPALVVVAPGLNM